MSQDQEQKLKLEQSNYKCQRCSLCSICLEEFIKKNDECIRLYHDKYDQLYKLNESVILSHGCRMTRDNKDLARSNVIRELYPKFNNLYDMNHKIAVNKCKKLHSLKTDTDITDTDKKCNCFLDETLLFKKLFYTS